MRLLDLQGTPLEISSHIIKTTFFDVQKPRFFTDLTRHLPIHLFFLHILKASLHLPLFNDSSEVLIRPVHHTVHNHLAVFGQRNAAFLNRGLFLACFGLGGGFHFQE